MLEKKQKEWKNDPNRLNPKWSTEESSQVTVKMTKKMWEEMLAKQRDK